VDYELSFLKALFFTIIVETLCLVILVKFIFVKQKTISIGVLLLTGIICSFATLPYLWFILPLFIKTKILYKVFSELFAIIVESLIIVGFTKLKIQYSILISIICNLLSYSLGLLLINLDFLTI